VSRRDLLFAASLIPCVACFDPTPHDLVGDDADETSESSVDEDESSASEPEEAGLVVDESDLDLGPVVVGFTATTRVLVRNEGEEASGVPQVSLLGDPAFSTVDSSCTDAIEPGGTCTLALQFTPPGVGTFTGEMTISASPGGASTLPLQGRGIDADGLSLAPATGNSADYGSVDLGDSAVSVFVVTATERSTGALLVDLSNDEEFSLLAPSAGDCVPGVTNLEPLAACTLGVEFRPTQSGATQTTLTVSGAEVGGASLVLSGSGPGGTGSLDSEETQLWLGDQEFGTTGPAQPWIVTNVGPVPISGITLSNTNPDEFQTVSGCSDTLMPNESCEVSIAFSPQLSGYRSGFVRIEDPDERGVTLAVSGNSQLRLTVDTLGGGTATLSTEDGKIACGDTCSALFDAGDDVLIHSETANGSGVYVSGWSACDSPSRTCAVTVNIPMVVVAMVTPMIHNLVFATSARFPANLGSVQAYDDECNRYASNAGINNAAGDGYIAAISSESSHFSARLRSNVRGFVRLDGRAVGTSISEMLDGAVYNAVAFDEDGRALDPYTAAWTGTLLDDDVIPETCAGWTTASSDEYGITGGPTMGPYAWIYGYASACDDELPLICLGNTSTADLTIPETEGKRIWLSSNFRPGTGETPDERCFEDRPTGVADAVAFISTTQRPASDVLDLDADYVRVDGQLVGTGADILARNLVSGIWQLGDGSYPRDDFSDAWVGSDTPDVVGDAVSTCNDWTSSDAGDTGATYGEFANASSRFWGRRGASIACDVFGSDERAVRLYCVER